MLSRRFGLLAILVASSGAATYTEEKDVVVLTPENFKPFIKEHPVALVEFYAPWCGHCKALEPKWAEAAAKAKKLSPPVPLAKVDADAHGDLAGEYDVSGYPTIKLFRDGEAEEYNGAREVDGILSHLKKITTYKPPTRVKTTDELAAAAGKKATVLGLFRMPVAASAAYKTFKALSWELAEHDIAFAYSADYSAPPVLPLTADGKKPAVPGLALVQMAAGGPPLAKATMGVPRKKEEFTEEAIVSWLNSNGVEAKIAEKEEEPEKNYSENEGEEGSEGYGGHDYD